MSAQTPERSDVAAQAPARMKASFRATREPFGHTVWLCQGDGPEVICTHGSAETARACAFTLARKGGCGSQPVCHHCTKVLPEELTIAIEVHSRNNAQMLAALGAWGDCA